MEEVALTVVAEVMEAAYTGPHVAHRPQAKPYPTAEATTEARPKLLVAHHPAEWLKLPKP